MKILNPYNVSGNWYKGNTHAHTRNSDGMLTPLEMSNVYKNKGYNFLIITDHLVVTNTPENNTSSFITISGIEIHNPHVVGLGMKVKNSFLATSNLSESIDAVVSGGGLSIVAHPHWMGLKSEDLNRTQGFIGIEIFNYVTLILNGKGYSINYWDELLDEGRHIWGIATDDAHREEHIGKGWIMVKAPALTEKDILDSIKKGSFYSSTGPSIEEIQMSGNIIKISCSDVKEIRFIGHGPEGCIRLPDNSKNMNSASCEIKGTEKYIRIECVDAEDNTAWTNPFFIEG